ncbi:MAG: hypothetical protein HFE77_03245 [Clostridiales bacterium]|nr:hypothetical protein [Clostridiales bacterium]
MDLNQKTLNEQGKLIRKLQAENRELKQENQKLKQRLNFDLETNQVMQIVNNKEYKSKGFEKTCCVPARV